MTDSDLQSFTSVACQKLQSQIYVYSTAKYISKSESIAEMITIEVILSVAINRYVMKANSLQTVDFPIVIPHFTLLEWSTMWSAYQVLLLYNRFNCIASSTLMSSAVVVLYHVKPMSS